MNTEESASNVIQQKALVVIQRPFSSTVRGVSWFAPRGMWRCRHTRKDGKRQSYYFPGTDAGKADAEATSLEIQADEAARRRRQEAYKKGQATSARKSNEAYADRLAVAAEQKQRYADIIAAGYRSMAQRVHPDHGGSHDGMIQLMEDARVLKEQLGVTSVRIRGLQED